MAAPAARRSRGAYVARIAHRPFGLSKALTGSVAAVSVGVVDDVSLLDPTTPRTRTPMSA